MSMRLTYCFRAEPLARLQYKPVTVAVRSLRNCISVFVFSHTTAVNIGITEKQITMHMTTNCNPTIEGDSNWKRKQPDNNDCRQDVGNWRKQQKYNSNMDHHMQSVSDNELLSLISDLLAVNLTNNEHTEFYNEMLILLDMEDQRLYSTGCDVGDDVDAENDSDYIEESDDEDSDEDEEISDTENEIVRRSTRYPCSLIYRAIAVRQ